MESKEPYTLNPTLWRTCRSLANEQRIKLLFAIFEHPNRCVSDLAEQTQMSPEHASIHLRALNSRGLIRQHRRKMMLLNSAEANENLMAAPLLLKALLLCWEQKVPIEKIIKQSTGFTHPRRIQIVRTVPPSGCLTDDLHDKTGISYSALSRHLDKLRKRGFILYEKKLITKTVPPDPLSKTLLHIIETNHQTS